MVKSLWYAETERMISKYLRDLEHLKSLKQRESTLLESITEIKMEMDELKNMIGQRNRCGIVPGAIRSTGEPGFAKLMVVHEMNIDRCTVRLVEAHKKLLKIRSRIDIVKGFVLPIKVYIDRLTSEQYRLIELRYIYRLSNYMIANNLHCSEYRVRYMINDIVNLMAEFTGKKFNRIFNAQNA
jgi:hypothetical protein